MAYLTWRSLVLRKPFLRKEQGIFTSKANQGAHLPTSLKSGRVTHLGGYLRDRDKERSSRKLPSHHTPQICRVRDQPCRIGEALNSCCKVIGRFGRQGPRHSTGECGVAVGCDDCYVPLRGAHHKGLRVAVADRASSWPPSPRTIAANVKAP